MHDDLLKRHLELVIEANKTTNITRISTWDEGMLLHVEDSLVGLPEVVEAPEGRLVDIGSGAGYPGIPLAIESGRATLLADSVGKKTAILASMVEELGLDNVEVYTGRIEDLAREKAGVFAVVTARALAQLSVLMELASPLLQDGGRLVCYKANVSDEELQHALALQERLGMIFVSDRAVELGDACRRIISFEKSGRPQINLPRKTGMAQKRPL
ncbi:16S rRNA (guanine(527)-N(7))-methyltransferase RsmG [Eggerthella sp. NSJ-70]|uniref:Ribosomal RNA small subunit methyltransferase G n=1 Tax=Eggerthella hominis TaxID=2763043 RepID=A0ABR7BSI2_9ACTN|nr:16S rRNA (guanine(527)-N(7))-methyltransferase RsmG [Eggerthella hominis]MBC5584570.1 16S rRNA (guanine(527)-N(7))-methyltransferase RsmG [Eggerthella hominis]